MMIFADLNDWMILVGRTHPLVVHLPVGILFIAVLFEVLVWWRKLAMYEAPLYWVWLVTAVTSIIACIAGFILADEGGYEPDIVTLHQWFGVSVALLSIFMFVAHQRMMLRTSVRTGFAAGALILVSVTGHFGGTLTHGSGFIEEPLATVFGLSVDEPVAAVQRKPIADLEKAEVYNDLVAPILEQKCYRCHNSKKQKGDLRLDEYEHIVKGGENGHTLVNGKPSESELYKRLVLPADDKHRMPPKGKTQLTKSEIRIIQWWIREGNGSHSVRVSEISQTDSMRIVLAAYTGEQNAAAVLVDTEIPDVVVPEAGDDVLKPLRDAGLSVTRYSNESPYLIVNCVNIPEFSDEHLKLLLGIADQIVWLKAGGTRITDAGMRQISRFKNLTRLSLENTAVTDKGMTALGAKQYLIYLNLVGTRVTDKSISAISQYRKLRSVYLWQSGITEAGAAELQRTLGSTLVNRGEQF